MNAPLRAEPPVNDEQPGPRRGRARRGGRGVDRALRRLRAERKARTQRFGLQLLLWVGLPTLVAGIYYGAFASDRFESVSTFTVQGVDAPHSTIEGMLGTITGSSAGKDTLVVRDFILSREMLGQLTTSHGFVEHYVDRKLDFFSRLSASSSSEDRFEYYLRYVDVEHDSQSNVLTLRVQAFSAEKAHSIASAILTISERMVNELSARARTDAIAFAKAEVDDAQKRLAEARRAVLVLQASGQQINPLEAASSLASLRGQLESDLARARAELRAAEALMQAQAPQVVSLRDRVRALDQEVRAQTRRMVGQDVDDRGVTADIARFEPAMFDKEFAERRLTAALGAVQAAHVEAARQQRYLVTIARPSTPDRATHPERVLDTFVTFLVAALLAGIGALLLASVREHARL